VTLEAKDFCRDTDLICTCYRSPLADVSYQYSHAVTTDSQASLSEIDSRTSAARGL
jgi:hypothetical protein